jgi:hypothetical protein
MLNKQYDISPQGGIFFKIYFIHFWLIKINSIGIYKLFNTGIFLIISQISNQFLQIFYSEYLI